MGILDKFSYGIQGEEASPRLVLLHGLLGSGANWRKITSQLKSDFQILSFDQRGHGRSFSPESGYSPDDYAGDLLEILDELGWQKIHLLGHSMGGRNALAFAASYPERLSSLILEDIGVTPNLAGAKKIKKLLALVPRPFASKREARNFLLNEFPALIPENVNGKVLGNYFYTNIEEKPDGTADWRFFLPGVLDSLHSGREWDGWGCWSSLKVPSLLIRGQSSEDLTRDEFSKMLEANPRGQGVEITDAGHWVHFDQPDSFIKSLKKFYKGAHILT